MTNPQEDNSHAIGNARSWAASILEMVERYRAYLTLEQYDDADEMRQEMEESALSVQVRGDWHSPGDPEGAKPSEYEILLSTGGPALRIIGELDEHGQPDGTPQMQWQDWFKPWTDYNETTNEEDEAIAEFVALFYFGE